MTTWLLFIVTILAIGEDLYEGMRPHSLFNLADIYGLIGLLLVLTGVYFRSWAAGILKKSQTLADIGPYSLMRHPLYFGSLLIGVGFCILIGDIENYFLVLGVLVIFHLRKARREERKLHVKFGLEWEDYTSRVGFLYPKVLPHHIASSWSIRQWVKNTEYGAFTTCFFGLICIEIWSKVLYRYPLSHLLGIN
jgi:protein-S-isoprenylcysteine O-methyltransferase Ste14